MTHVLVVFESKYGQSRKIAEFIADLVHRRGLRATLARPSAAAALNPAEHDAVVVVAPIYVGRHAKTVERFLRTYGELLSLVPTAFVSVSNSAANADPTARAMARKLAVEFIGRVGARPRVVLTAGGAFAYPRYGIFVRLVMRSIAKRTGGPLDTSRVHELTDWTKLESELAPFLDAVEAAQGGARAIATTPDASGIFSVAGQRALKVNP
jgi:menaquinone-dependent protoporphyrinogen oxidase